MWLHCIAGDVQGTSGLQPAAALTKCLSTESKQCNCFTSPRSVSKTLKHPIYTWYQQAMCTHRTSQNFLWPNFSYLTWNAPSLLTSQLALLSINPLNPSAGQFERYAMFKKKGRSRALIRARNSKNKKITGFSTFLQLKP